MLKIEDAFILSGYCHDDEKMHISIKVYLSDNTGLVVNCAKEDGAKCFADALENMAKAIREKL